MIVVGWQVNRRKHDVIHFPTDILWEIAEFWCRRLTNHRYLGGSKSKFIDKEQFAQVVQFSDSSRFAAFVLAFGPVASRK